MAFNTIKKYFHHRFLIDKLKQIQVSRKSVNLNEAKEIGILFDATDTDQKQLVENLAKQLKDQNKKTVLLGFYNFPKPAINFSFDYFNKKNLNWRLAPVGHTVESFIQRKFDILINLSVKEILPLEYISALSQANFRVGPYEKNKTYCYDLMIDTGEEKDLKNLIEQVKHYLHLM